MLTAAEVRRLAADACAGDRITRTACSCLPGCEFAPGIIDRLHRESCPWAILAMIARELGDACEHVEDDEVAWLREAITDHEFDAAGLRLLARLAPEAGRDLYARLHHHDRPRAPRPGTRRI